MLEIKNRRTQVYLTIAVHVVTWVLLLNLPLLSNNYNGKSTAEYFFSWIPALSSAIVFYANFFFFIPKLFWKKRIVWFIAANIGVYGALILVLQEIRPFLTVLQLEDLRRPNDIEVFFRLIISFLATTGIAIAIRITSEWIRLEASRKELEQEHLKSELMNLKNQLNPHFFFNILNTIYGLIPQNTQLAQNVVHRLGKLMRYHLYESNERMMPLQQEIEFINTYLDLMRIRVPSSVIIESNFPSQTHGVKVAPLLFIPLIENSFKHGISAEKDSSIKMNLEIVDKKKLIFTITNTSYPKKDNDRSGSGIGLGNLRKRLSLLYPDKHMFDTHTAKEYFVCTLTLDL